MYKENKMTPIEKAQRLMKEFDQEIQLSNKALLYLYCIHFIHLRMEERLPDTRISYFYHSQRIEDIMNQIDDQNLNPGLYNQFKNEASALQYIITYEAKWTPTA
jgi:hypothetical protein